MERMRFGGQRVPGFGIGDTLQLVKGARYAATLNLSPTESAELSLPFVDADARVKEKLTSVGFTNVTVDLPNKRVEGTWGGSDQTVALPDEITGVRQLSAPVVPAQQQAALPPPPTVPIPAPPGHHKVAPPAAATTIEFPDQYGNFYSGVAPSAAAATALPPPPTSPVTPLPPPPASTIVPPPPPDDKKPDLIGWVRANPGITIGAAAAGVVALVLIARPRMVYATA